MIGLDDFRKRMKAEVDKTKKIRSVQVSGKNLDDALRQASLELSLPLRVLEYEVLEKGRSGILGLKGTPCHIIAYQMVEGPIAVRDQAPEYEFEAETAAGEVVPQVNDANGRYSVRLGRDGAWVKVFPPIGEGEPVALDDVVQSLQERMVTETELEIVSEAVRRGDMMWVKAGDFYHNPSNDAFVSLEVAEEEMKAYIRAHEAGAGGADLSADDIKGFLSGSMIVFGILDDAVQEFEDFPVYDSPVLVAAGAEPSHGEDAQVIYNFETEPDRIHIHEREDGSVDFKELNRFQNVVKGQPLARKVPPGIGREGRTVYGRYIRARDGADLEIELGNNVTVIDNGATVVAAASGHVLLKSGKITVEKILVIPGSVDARTGNINALGSVEVRGNIEDGYSVSAQGNIEVAGFVGRANLNAGGDIIVSRGINGGEGTEFGHINAGKSIWSSFIQNAQASAGEFVIVGAGIVNSDVVAQKKVLCRGRRAKIVGGHVRAAEEVNAVTFGSAGASETLIEVGFDPKTKEEAEQLEEQRAALEAEKNTVSLNLQGLKHQVEIEGRQLSAEKKQVFKELRQKKAELNRDLVHLGEEIEKRRESLESLLVNGKISAFKKVFAGVVLRIQDVEYAVRDSYENAVTFILEDEYIRTVKYHDIEEDLARR